MDKNGWEPQTIEQENGLNDEVWQNTENKTK